eukprot:CAMPEP_0114602260 /NCGR_PEP_ID=MMETSP0125-20121206/24863_1 /TAXON_ID=485358 ORGANISM="Aristerostoma sp., Strain ATCC 50986" /NCGR_SAMPLE_ID=MMETSP0125 /ASSEMBLY_ACC=CAM_ASM_000245 /LENGTH=151 /DNA_ID=CAMNT_0001812279 /DNA_START=270 /DNA_END=725 /DNA_ORIENTATION=-
MISSSFNELTSKVCGAKRIVDDPIVLKVFSQHCPDLTLIDLPGITRIANDKFDVEKATKDMSMRYASDPRTIILALTPANVDISTSDGIDLALKADPYQERTIGVLSKIDIMDQGTDASKILKNQSDVKLSLGFVGIKGRSQEDINNNMTV